MENENWMSQKLEIGRYPLPLAEKNQRFFLRVQKRSFILKLRTETPINSNTGCTLY